MLNNLPSLRVVALRPKIARIAIVVDVVVWVVEMGVIVALIWFKVPVSVSSRGQIGRGCGPIGFH